METAATDNNGAYEEGGAGITTGRLEAIEPTLKDHTQNTPSVASATKEEYEVSSTNVQTGDVFKIKRESSGVVKRTCTSPGGSPGGKGACPTNGDW
jgi:hypothetical protein